MHPVVPPQGNVQRSWSDEHIPVNAYSRAPKHSAPRSSSFSASRAPQPQWDSPPPPVPPLPPSLLPGSGSGSYNPPSAHTNFDLTFVKPPRHPILPRPSSVHLNSFHDFTPPLPRQATDSALSWSPRDHRNHLTPSSNFAPPRPAPPLPPIGHGFIPNTPNLGGGHPSSQTHAQSFTYIKHQPSPPQVPPVVLPHSVSAFGEGGFERSLSMNFQAAPSSPSHVPPTAFIRPVNSHDEGRFERSPSMNFQAAPSPPPHVPPAGFVRPVSSHDEGRFEGSPSMGYQVAPSPHHILPRPVPPHLVSAHKKSLSINFQAADSPLPVPPVVPPRPASAHSDRRSDKSHTMDLQVSQPSVSLAPPFVLPPRPASALGEVKFDRSPTMSFQAAPSPPPVPPKTSTAPVTPREHILTPSGHSIISSSSDIQRISDTSATRSGPHVPETKSLDSGLKHAVMLSLQEPHRKQPAVKTLEDKKDNELARTLAESLSLSSLPEQNEGVRNSLPTATSHLTIITQSPVEHDVKHSNGMGEIPSRRRPSFLSLGGIEILSPEELEDHAAHERIMQAREDEEVTRRLQEEEEQWLAAERREREREDEEVTRQLQEEEEKRLADELRERERADEKRARMDAEFTKRLQEEEAMRLAAERREREQRDEAWGWLDAEIARREEAEEQARKMVREAQELNDAEIARRMAESSDGGAADSSRKMIREAQERKDAEMARRTVETLRAEQPHAAQGALPAHHSTFLSRATDPPQYNDIVAASRPPLRGAQSAPQVYNDTLPPTRPRGATSASMHGPMRPEEQGNRGSSATMDFLRPGRRSEGLRPEGMSPPSREPSPGGGNSARISSSPSINGPSPGPLVAPEDDGMESDVLRGVSYGFTPPDMHSAPSKLEAPFPEVIHLLRAPSPPFHIMATSWRHLMRLLGQLETSIQADLDAIAQSKVGYQLRVVVQFAKLPHSANTWRTILHLTLDHRIPRDKQNAWRNQNKDTTMLPYSYTLGEPTPYLVNDANSQFYVIPLSTASPFPILPRSFPDLAMYLQSAMQDSRMRKVQNDTSNGMRRLAKMVADCYPEEVATEQEGRKASRGVGNLFKRVVGLGGDREASGASGVNEDVYDIITPFRIDQYTVS